MVLDPMFLNLHKTAFVKTHIKIDYDLLPQVVINILNRVKIDVRNTSQRYTNAIYNDSQTECKMRNLKYLLS